VSFEEGKAWAAARGLPFIETSSKDRINVIELFEGEYLNSVNNCPRQE